MISLFFVLICASKILSYGYDSGTDQGTCGKRTGRVYQPPCDLGRQSYCTTAGTAYPWHAVRRFVRDNQGLIRRMYGDQLHSSVLRAELESAYVNEINQRNRKPDHNIYAGAYKGKYVNEGNRMDNELYNKEKNSPRLLPDDAKYDNILDTKFVFSQKPAKGSELHTLPHFRPTSTQKSVESNTIPETITRSVEYSVFINITELSKAPEENVTTLTDGNADTTTEELTTDNMTTLEESTEEMSTENLESKEKAGTMLFQDMDEDDGKTKNHINYNLRGVNACPVKEEVVAPFWANNTRGEVLALLNIYPFEQYVHWEKCSFEHRQMYCRDGCRCEQQYRLHRLLAYDPNNECRGIFSDWFRFPSCCVCKCYDMPVDFKVTSRSPRSRRKDKDMPRRFKPKR